LRFGRFLIIFSFFVLPLTVSPIYIPAIISDSASPKASANSLNYYPQDRYSNYTIETKAIAPYPEIVMSDQQVSFSNDSLVEGMLSLNLTSPSAEVKFDLTTSDLFLAIDGASQAYVLRVNYTIYYPDGTLATKKPITTTATSPMHFYMLNPPTGGWRIVATLIDTGDTPAWIQAISYNNGTRWVTALEKIKMSLFPGQNLYYKIPLWAGDWFYLYVNRLAGADISIDLRKQGAYNTPYRSYNNFASEFFPSKSHTPGVYLLKIINKGKTDIFVEIVKTLGINFRFNIDGGNTTKSRFQVDLEFFNFTITGSYDWIAFDGAVTSSGMTARYLIINPNLDIVYDSTSSGPSSFIEKIISYPSQGSYFIAIFGTEYAIATMKITSASSVSSIDYVKLDQNWTFTQSGQTFYLKILQSQRYFLFAATTFSQAKVKYAFFNPNLVSIWTWGPSTGLAFYQPTKPTIAYYILKVTGETNSKSLIHARFQGLEDHQITTPDSSNFKSRFKGDIIAASVGVYWDSSYVLQHTGAFCSSSRQVYIALFDASYSLKWSRTFTNNRETYFQRWRKGYENPQSGQWLQVFIALGDSVSAEINTLQSGEESKYIVTPFQSLEKVEWDNWWQMRVYKVDIGSPKWFGIVSQLLSVNMSYPIHPYASMWVYDSTLNELVSGQVIDSTNQFRTNFWPNPKPGVWLVVIVGFQDPKRLDPLNLSVTYITDADFPRPATVHNINTGLNYTTIQEAIDAPETQNGHTIFVEAGIYYEYLLVNKAVTLLGESEKRTIIDGFGSRTNVIEVTVDNVTITGFSIRNSGTSWPFSGIALNNIKNCNISRNEITSNRIGIYLDESANNSISGNTITNNSYGVWLKYSSSNRIVGNNITTNKWQGIYLWYSSNNNIIGNTFTNDGLFVVGSYQNKVERNFVTGKPLVYLENVSNHTVGEAGQVILVNCNNVRVKNLNLFNASAGLELWNTNNSKIENNSLKNNVWGIYLLYSASNSVSGNNVTNNLDGIVLEGSNYNNVFGNNVTYNSYGIMLSWSSNYNNVTGNNVTTNRGDGIYFYLSEYNSVYENNILNNIYNIVLYESANNKFYHNNFRKNAGQVIIYRAGYSNIWDDGYPSGGNYWSDYTGVDANKDGIGDTPYVIDSNNQDRYPLMLPLGDKNPPVTSANYDYLWRNISFTINLTATDDLSGVAETYYKINDGTVQNMSKNGLPLITTEDVNNKLEYWSRDKSGNEEFPHKFLTGIKLDKTPPTGSIKINNDASYATSTSMTLTLNASDATSGVDQIRYSNDGVWDTEPWETYSLTKAWTLTVGDGTKKVYFQIKDNSGLMSITYSDTIILDTTFPSVSISSPTEGQTVTSSNVTVSWSGSDTGSGIDHYEVKLDLGNSINKGTSTSHTFNGVSDGSHTVYVKAIDKAGNSKESMRSFSVNLLPTSVTLNNPSDITHNSMKLTWTQNTEADFAKYEIYQSTSSGTLGTKIYTITDRTITSYVVTGLSVDTTYYFTVRVVDSGNLQADSNQVSGKTKQVDTTPPTVSATMNPSSPDTTKTVTFTVVVNDNTGGSGIANVTLYIDGNPAQTWTTSGTHTYTGGPYSEGTHTYYVQAFDNANNKGRDPITGNKEFTVSVPAQPIPLWQILALVLGAVAVIAVIALYTRHKKETKVTPP